jgi:hypothetical protein
VKKEKREESFEKCKIKKEINTNKLDLNKQEILEKNKNKKAFISKRNPIIPSRQRKVLRRKAAQRSAALVETVSAVLSINPLAPDRPCETTDQARNTPKSENGGRVNLNQQ